MKTLKTLLLAALSLGLACGVLGACTTASGSESSSASSDETSSSSAAADSSSSSAAASGTIGDENWIYYAEDLQCKLTLDYTGHSFWTDGIEQVTLAQTVDGDTAHFNTTSTDSNGETYLKARFYGIDTPESTGQVQPYGKKASAYTKSILTEANANGTIVVSSAQSSYGTPNPDSTGSRYVSLIWVSLDTKNAPYDELVLLNLMIVEYGYSWVKNVADMPDYANTFYAAETQATNYKLNLFSGEDDPDYNYGDYEDVSLLDLKNEVVATLEDPTHVNAYNNEKVRVQGTVAGYANNIIYLEDFCFYYDEDGNPVDKDGNPNDDERVEVGVTGEYAGINIFAGMSAISSNYTTVGNYIQVAGLGLESESYGFQITSASFKTIPVDDNDAQLLIEAADNTDYHALHVFEYTAAELDQVIASNNYESLNCAVKVTDAISITDGYDGSSGTYLYSSHRWSVYYTFTYSPYGSGSGTTWQSYKDLVGNDYYFSGVLGLHYASSGSIFMYLYPRESSDIEIVPEVTSCTITTTDTMTMAVGGSIKLEATVVGNLTLVSWSSSDESVATVSSSGRVRGRGAGTVTITAYATADSSVYDTIEITVTEA